MQKFISCIYFILLIFPFIVLVTNLAPLNRIKFEKRELRRPNPFPNLDLLQKSDKPVEAFSTWPSKFELWFNDHYPFRASLLSGNRSFNKALDIKKRGTIDGQVIRGINDRLYLGDYHTKAMSQHSGNGFVLSDELVSSKVAPLIKINKWLLNNNVFFGLIIPPDKHSIYPEDYPKWLTPYQGLTSAEVISLSAREQDVPVLFLKDSLLPKKATYNNHLYPNTDSHWTDLGAFMAYRDIMKFLSKNFEPLKSLTLKSYTVTPNKEGYDLARFADITNVNDFSVTVELNEKQQELNAFDFTGYSIEFNKGDTIKSLQNRVIINKNALNDATIIVCRDSFAKAMIPFLNQTFTKIIYTANTNIVSHKELVKQFKPDIVLLEIVERGMAFFDYNKIASIQ